MIFKVPVELQVDAEIIALKRIRNNHTIVAAYWPSSVLPYVTWAVADDGSAYWGHYYATEIEALEDWKTR